MYGEKILVVDDNIENCNMMADLLDQWGYRVKEAHQGKEVLPLLKQFRPDLLLLDVMLPGMNGFEICKRIKQSPETENIAVIMLTVLDEAEDRARGLSVGADLFISRPVNYKELRRQIEFVLAKKRKVMEMESPGSVRDFFLNLIQRLSPELFRQTLPVLHYSGNIAKLLDMSKDMIAMIELGAVLHGFSYLFGADISRLQTVREVLQPLRVAESLTAYLDVPGRNVCETCFSGAYGCWNAAMGSVEGAPVVRLSSRFCELAEELGDKQAAYRQLSGELSPNVQDCPIYTALAQVLDDEAFVQKLKAGDL